MKIRILSISNKAPAWIESGLSEFKKRLSGACQIDCIEIPFEKSISVANEQLRKQIKSAHFTIALDRHGKMQSSESLAQQLAKYQLSHPNIDFLIGGPDGLTAECLALVNATWSFSLLTFPHHLARLILLEQLYRGFAILNNHPYHR